MSRKLDFIKVEVVPHDPSWRDVFEAESKQIALALTENAIAIHHIGSTAISQIHAKPIIDMLVVVKDIIKVDTQNSALEALGYQAMGEFGISGRRFFRKGNEAGIRTHHIHTFEVNSPQIERHLRFRDYMISHPEDAQQYSELKQELANKYYDNIQAYMDGKAGFIKAMDMKAAKWRASD
ncbi:MAG: GrpB family protein [Oscillatoriales cyanobacterium]|uniref:GrpB family protein n=1 Tax=unclassified Microcoleus TaxID=2642155 RepID=UPI001DADC106|nr:MULTISPECIES: GrpB family protein [unclassified Microcoleus]TAF96404.1 MAG: GrpB family protein [Oscillatoriales cyanobacterium]MCC3437945.1 GrpB family protein [Microcoleus sp. PH2017_05_CCC_O_A]MCC3594839.1 GrpB family protein [Microcoleus sp. PH2017_28_MFU_U_A]TAG18771.1 MAG: GrpB family protein [Oscillatoriales cyanobacterium]TAG48427.1 MAG: GrpB family protein [Oscillatoriales cyanobacterium]